jgi:hypothetical protein
MTDTPKPTVKKTKPVIEEVVEATPETPVEVVEAPVAEVIPEAIPEPTPVIVEEPKKVPFVGDERKFHGAQYGQSMNSRLI